MEALRRTLPTSPLKVSPGNASTVKVTGCPERTLPISASLTDTQICIRLRSLAIRKRLGVLRLAATVCTDIDAPVNDDTVDRRSNRAILQVSLRPPLGRLRLCQTDLSLLDGGLADVHIRLGTFIGGLVGVITGLGQRLAGAELLRAVPIPFGLRQLGRQLD